MIQGPMTGTLCFDPISASEQLAAGRKDLLHVRLWPFSACHEAGLQLC